LRPHLLPDLYSLFLQLTGGSKAVFANTKFLGNLNDNSQGGALVVDQGSQAIIEGSTFSGRSHIAQSRFLESEFWGEFLG
jgi:hypothetical protein